MDNHVYKQIELTGTSTTSIEDAVTGAVAKAAETIRHLRWLEVKDIRAHLDGRNLTHWQVTVKVGFTLED